MEKSVQQVIEARYPIRVVDLARVDAGTASHNFVVSDDSGRRWFAKVYPAGTDLEAAEAAIALSSFARAGGLPVPAAHPTGGGDVLARAAGTALSLWDLVDDAETAEGGLVGRRWDSVGRVVGLLHRRLAVHPMGKPVLRPASEFVDLEAAGGAYDRLIAAYRRRGTTEPYQQWALEAATLRRTLLPGVGDLLERLPELTMQVVHGDLTAPNLLLRGDDVAAIVDFQPAHPGYLAWEIARIACDPRTVVADDSWLASLPLLLEAYRDAYPAVRDEDLDSVVALGCAYTLASTYPLAAPLATPAVARSEHAEASLQRYGRARHDAALVMLEHLGM